jgi:hypothetical protein
MPQKTMGKRDRIIRCVREDLFSLYGRRLAQSYRPSQTHGAVSCWWTALTTFGTKIPVRSRIQVRPECGQSAGLSGPVFAIGDADKVVHVLSFDRLNKIAADRKTGRRVGCFDPIFRAASLGQSEEVLAALDLPPNRVVHAFADVVREFTKEIARDPERAFSISWRGFEHLVVDALTSQGF